MVPSARLELAQLSPLPPQDSVSTNFTTTAGLDFLSKRSCRTEKAIDLNLKSMPLCSEELISQRRNHLPGI